MTHAQLFAGFRSASASASAFLFHAQTQSEAINDVTHTPRCQPPLPPGSQKCQGNKYCQRSGGLNSTHSTAPCHVHYVDVVNVSALSATQRVPQRRCKCVCVCHAPRLLATLGLRHAFYPLEQQRQRRRQRHHRAALYANGVFIKVVFILRDIFAASFALFLCFSFFFFWRF